MEATRKLTPHLNVSIIMMKPIEKQYRFTWDFYILWILIALGIILIAKPWQFDMHIVSKVAVTIGMPFILAIVLHTFIHFIIAIVQSGSYGFLVLYRFLIFLFSMGLIFGVLLITGLYTESRARFFGFVFALLSTFIADYIIKRKTQR